MANLPILSYTTPEEFINYYYESLKADLNVYDLQISKVGFVGFFLNLLGYTHFDLKQYYDSLFKEAFVGTSQTEESQYIHASTYGYIPLFATAAVATGIIEFDMINWLPRRQANVVRREVIVGYNFSNATYIPLSSTFKVENFLFSIDAIYKFVEIEDNGSYYYYADITTSDGTKVNIPSTSSTISAPLYLTSQYTKKELTFEIKPYNFGSFQTYYFGIDAGYFLSGLEVYITEVGSIIEEQYDVKYTKYLEKGSDTSVFLRKITSINYVIEFGSGLRGKWISGATVRLIIKSTRGTSGNLTDKTNLKLQISGKVLAFDYIYSTGGQLSPTGTISVLQQPLVDFDYSESGSDPLSGEDLRDAIVNYIQTRDNMMSQQDFYNIAINYLDDFKFLFKKFNVFDNIFHLCRSFRDRNQSIFYTTNYTEQVMNLAFTALSTYVITAVASTGGSLISGSYSYFVVGIDEWGQSTPSVIVIVDVDNGAGENSVIITWDHVPCATKYHVYGRNLTFRDQYWEIDATVPPTSTYSYTDDGTTGTSHVEPFSYELQDIKYRPTVMINSETFISPFIYKGNTRMNYYDGYLMKDLDRVEFAEIIPEIITLGTGFDIPMVYLNLDYDETLSKTIVKLKSYQTISNLVFTISIYGTNIDITNKRMSCFPLTNNYFEYEYTNVDTFGIFEDEIQIEVKGGTSTYIITNEVENFTIGAGTRTLDIKIGTIPYSITLTTGSVTAAQIVSDIDAIVPSLTSVYTDDEGFNRVKFTTPTAGFIYILTTSTCLGALGLTGDNTNPAVLNGPMTTYKFTCRTDKFFQILDTSDQIKLIRYTVRTDSYIINIPVVYNATFISDPDYYLDKFKNFIVTSLFNENRMVTDNVQCRFLNTYLIESPFIEAIFLQSGQIFSNTDYVWLPPVSSTQDEPPVVTLDKSRYLVSTTPVGGSYFDGHANEIAIYDTSIAPPFWIFDIPNVNEFVLDNETNIYYRWDGTNWINIPNIVLPLNIRIEIKADKNYVQRNNIDMSSEKENLILAVTEYLQKGFSGSTIIFYNSLMVEFVHNNRNYIKSVKVYVTDSSIVPNEMNNGIETRTDNEVMKNLKNKLDIVKYVPPLIYWDVDNVEVIIYIE